MVSLIENLSKDNLHVIFKFLTANWRQPMGICKGIKTVYGDCSYSHKVVVEWSNNFRQERESTKDPHPSSWKLLYAQTGASEFGELSQILNIDMVTVHSNIHIGYHKFAARWIRRKIGVWVTITFFYIKLLPVASLGIITTY